MMFEKSMDNRSILLIRLDTEHYLNLSPFVVDENAFLDKTDICKIYFFSHYSKQASIWFYKYVNKPDDPRWEITEESHPLIKPQFDAFAEHILQQNLNDL